MSSREPLWFCHECRAEMRPLMAPDPICASCRGSFVEKLENPADDPRQLQHHVGNGLDDTQDYPGAFDGFLRALRNDMDRGREPFGARSRSPTVPRSPDGATGSTGFRFEVHSGPGGGARTFILGGPNALGRSPEQRERTVPTMSEFLRRENDHDIRAHQDITGPLMAQYLLALLGREQTGRGDPFSELLGIPRTGQLGDYVFNQEALDQIMTQLMENSTSGRPVPATEELINKLPKEVLTEGSPLLEKDCAVCKEQFKLVTEDPDELVVVTLPCKHPFHEGCIMPWLKSSGTCPVCRYALIAQPGQHSSGGSSGGSSTTRPTSPPSGSRPRSSDGSRGVGFFRTLFGGGAGGSSSGNYSARSPYSPGRTTDQGTSSHTTPSFPGQWIEEID
ncbi:hypothetical protein PAXINDRAFT_124451 [Paxillus involutus ATCC 200175]|nr:hypothetical protein PAXINDRAFT_124451 [Paxillus involutus ATCC 200175]